MRIKKLKHKKENICDTKPHTNQSDMYMAFSAGSVYSMGGVSMCYYMFEETKLFY